VAYIYPQDDNLIVNQKRGWNRWAVQFKLPAWFIL